MIERIQWLGNGSFIVQGPPLIYINPRRVARSVFHADVILVTQDHYEHCSLADIDKLRGPNTRVIGSEQVAREIDDCIVLRPWQSLTVDRACIKAVPTAVQAKHPQADNGLGFIISVNYFDIYYSGDTQAIPELERIRPDIAILPIDNHGALTVSEAVQLVKAMRPRWVIPGGTGGAALLDAESFRQQVKDLTEVVLLPRQK
jgi:L-ascorbate metabolism protein UlaG (beta-lactamase superfamily)